MEACYDNSVCVFNKNGMYEIPFIVKHFVIWFFSNHSRYILNCFSCIWFEMLFLCETTIKCNQATTDDVSASIRSNRLTIKIKNYFWRFCIRLQIVSSSIFDYFVPIDNLQKMFSHRLFEQNCYSKLLSSTACRNYIYLYRACCIPICKTPL